jgi:hypothetical protein
MGLRFLPNGALVGDTQADALAARDAERLRRYRRYLDFYEGKHWDRTRPGRTQLTVNYARAVVDKGVSYLLGRGLNFAVPAEAGGLAPEAAQRAERLLYETYDANDLDAVDLAAALNAALLGDAVFKVCYAPAERRIRVLNLDPFAFFPRWSGDDLGRLWRVDLAYRLAAEEAERLYGTRGRQGGQVAVVERWTAERFSLAVDDRPVQDGPNPYGLLPFVHVPNLQPPNECWGVSDRV